MKSDRPSIMLEHKHISICFLLVLSLCFFVHVKNLHAQTEKLQDQSGKVFPESGAGTEKSGITGKISISEAEGVRKAGIEEKFLEAVKAYETGDFPRSSALFEEIAMKHGVSNHGLFYNIGNAYLKQDNYGMAMLWYKRASQLAPGDPDLAFNMEYLEKRLKDDFEIKKSVFSGAVFFISGLMSANTVVKTALILNLFLWIFSAAFYFSGKTFLKPVIFCLGTAVLIFVFNAFYCYYGNAFTRKAVIISPETPVRSGTSENAPELFRLHAGTTVLVQETIDGYHRISDGDTRTGWIKAGETALISHD